MQTPRAHSLASAPSRALASPCPRLRAWLCAPPSLLASHAPPRCGFHLYNCIYVWACWLRIYSAPRPLSFRHHPSQSWPCLAAPAAHLAVPCFAAAQSRPWHQAQPARSPAPGSSAPRAGRAVPAPHHNALRPASLPCSVCLSTPQACERAWLCRPRPAHMYTSQSLPLTLKAPGLMSARPPPNLAIHAHLACLQPLQHPTPCSCTGRIDIEWVAAGCTHGQ